MNEIESAIRLSIGMNNLVYVCSPLRGDIQQNIENAKTYSRIVTEFGYIPFTPHLYFTTFLDIENDADNELGISMGLAVLPLCAELWVFGSRVSDGMRTEIELADKLGIFVNDMRFNKFLED